MKYIKTLVGVFAAVLFTTATYAAPSTNAPLAKPNEPLGNWTLSLSGAGSTALNSANAMGTVVGAEIQLGRSVDLVFPAELGVRQGIGYADARGAGSSWVLSTRVYSDWPIIRLGSLQLDAGANVGPTYGNTKLTWTAAPEVVGRLYLKKDVDVFTRVEYPFNLNEAKTANSLAYTLGIRVRF